MNLEKVDEVIDGYGSEASWLVMILQDAQEACNYLAPEILEHVADRLALPLSHVYRVATFYSSFSLTRRGEYVVRVCDGTACHLRGGNNLRDQITRVLGIEKGQTTHDGLFTLETVACLGACALAPVMAVNREYHGQMTTEKIEQILAQYREAAAAPPVRS